MSEEVFNHFLLGLEGKLGFKLPAPFWASNIEEGVYYGSWGEERRRFYVFLKNNQVHCVMSPTRRGPFVYDRTFGLDEFPQHFLDMTKQYFRVNYV